MRLFTFFTPEIPLITHSQKPLPISFKTFHYICSGYTSFEEDTVNTGIVQVKVKVTGDAEGVGRYKIHPFRKVTSNPSVVDSCPTGTPSHDLGKYAVEIVSTQKTITLVGKKSIFGQLLGEVYVT